MDGHTFVHATLILAVFNLAIWCSNAKFNVSLILLRLRYASKLHRYKPQTNKSSILLFLSDLLTVQNKPLHQIWPVYCLPCKNWQLACKSRTITHALKKTPYESHPPPREPWLSDNRALLTVRWRAPVKPPCSSMTTNATWWAVASSQKTYAGGWHWPHSLEHWTCPS